MQDADVSMEDRIKASNIAKKNIRESGQSKGFLTPLPKLDKKSVRARNNRYKGTKCPQYATWTQTDMQKALDAFWVEQLTIRKACISVWGHENYKSTLNRWIKQGSFVFNLFFKIDSVFFLN